MNLAVRSIARAAALGSTATLSLAIVAVVLFTGCADKPVEKAPEDIEKARQQHIDMMKRESGQTTPGK